MTLDMIDRGDSLPVSTLNRAFDVAPWPRYPANWALTVTRDRGGTTFLSEFERRPSAAAVAQYGDEVRFVAAVESTA